MSAEAVRRYNGIEEDPEGAYVYYDDYAALHAQAVALARHLTQSTHGYKPDACSACQQAKALLEGGK